ncbi:Uncharacterised protein g9354 [Pycnogonum litorale]
MYGLILMNMREYVVNEWGEEMWEVFRKEAGISQSTFSTHQVYPDKWITSAGEKVQEVLNIDEKQFFSSMGASFVRFLGPYGYHVMLKVLGRHLRNFINNLDNLHAYLTFSYPQLEAASFFCENETDKGLTLHYRSKRRGFVWYVSGQIKEVGRMFYKTDIDVELITQEVQGETLHVTFQLHFDNKALNSQRNMERHVEMNQISASVIIKMFPFCIIFGDDLIIRTLGSSLFTILPNAIGKRVNHIFDLTRPLILLTWTNIMAYCNNVFEMSSKEPVLKNDNSNSNTDDKFKIKGQMMYVPEWRSFFFLATPLLSGLDQMVNAGLYMNDLCLHDFSRDRVLTEQEPSSELKLALETELNKSRELEEMMLKVDDELKKTDELLYQMIPKAVADRLRKGVASVDTCQYFDATTILFSDVVGFSEISCRISPMEIVAMLNGMYSMFDKLTEEHGVYKVETIGDSYMVVCGAPERNAKHAEKVCEMALDMVNVIGELRDPSTDESLRIRIGIHSGAVVAGVVGLKAPRYCLFGDTVNTASRMESNSEPLKIHISEYTRMYFSDDQWDVEVRGNVQVKGKGNMKTYWLHGRVGGIKVPSRASRKSIANLKANIEQVSQLNLGTPEHDTRSLYTPIMASDSRPSSALSYVN